jgi:hypothetical protein
MQPEFSRTLEVIEPGPTAPETAERVSQTSDAKAVAGPPHKPERDTVHKDHKACRNLMTIPGDYTWRRAADSRFFRDGASMHSFGRNICSRLR